MRHWTATRRPSATLLRSGRQVPRPGRSVRRCRVRRGDRIGDFKEAWNFPHGRALFSTVCALSSCPLVKLFHYSLALGAVCLCACAVAPSPTAPSAIATADALVMDSGFDPVFFRAFVQNGYETPDRLEPIRILRGPLRLYLRTQDDEGRPIDDATLDTTERTLIAGARLWSGETFGIIQVERGIRTREKVPAGSPVSGRARHLPVNAADRPLRRRRLPGIQHSGACRCGMQACIRSGPARTGPPWATTTPTTPKT